LTAIFLSSKGVPSVERTDHIFLSSSSSHPMGSFPYLGYIAPEFSPPLRLFTTFCETTRCHSFTLLLLAGSWSEKVLLYP
jgi:hypothetical protein